MKQILALGLSLLLSGLALAQKDVTKFMGIPVDGTKQAMMQKLKAKGFTYNASCDCLKGQFNGRESELRIGTNGNKVYRIVVSDANNVDEANIKIRFNNLARQFEKNEKYAHFYESQIIDEDVDISYEMSVNKKRFQAEYFQIIDEDTADFTSRVVLTAIAEGYRDMNDEELKKNTLNAIYANTLREIIAPRYKHRQVWFTIHESYGKYWISIYYDNVLNQANGEDL
ncbi:MAG: hypothetical protein IJ761_04840 [Bacteroidales bacterium]|nr:hypothetical protein [Bacteroidales bacterium]